jgi:hypothetical protein
MIKKSPMLIKKNFLENFWYLWNMKKIIRLTENDLTRLVRRVILENEEEEIRRNILRRVLPNSEKLWDYINDFNYDFTEGDLAAGYEPCLGIFDERVFVGYDESTTLKDINTYAELLGQHIITIELDDEFGEEERWFEEVSVKYYKVMKDILLKIYPKEVNEGWEFYNDVTKLNMKENK